MKKDFNLFISQLSETNATLDYFTDFEKVIKNTNNGWLSAKNKLGEAYSIIPSVYNLATVDEFIAKIKAEL